MCCCDLSGFDHILFGIDVVWDGIQMPYDEVRNEILSHQRSAAGSGCDAVSLKLKWVLKICPAYGGAFFPAFEECYR